MDIRVVAATNRNLLQLVEAGKFQNGSVLPVECSKRGRSSAPKSGGLSGDCRSYLRSTDAERSKEEEQAFFNILRRCQDYPWPGNVQELNNLVERVSLLLHQGVPEKEAFQAFYNEWQKEEIPSPEEKQIETAGAIIDGEAVLAALRRNGGNASRTARAWNQPQYPVSPV